MTSWPSYFPAEFEVNGFSISPVSNSTAIDTESGPPLSRRRFTGRMYDVNGILPPVAPDVAMQIEEFFRADCAEGSRPFTWVNPVDRSAMTFLFMAPPQLTPVSGLLWRVSLRLRSLP